ncbi:MAG: hypothetical protein M3N47_14275, partial [Chloroflexota bacterium]|nr:hypothetical protein [Chloroflexota bacterium]
MEPDDQTERRISRRRLQALALALPAPLALAALTGKGAGIVLSQSAEGTAAADSTPVLAPTPSCADADDLE